MIWICFRYHWEEDFQAEIIDIGHDSIGFKLGRNLKDREIDELLSEIKDLNVEPACRGGFEELRSMIKEKLSRIHLTVNSFIDIKYWISYNRDHNLWRN